MSGVDLIRAERERQLNVEGWTPEHDDGHTNGELAEVAAFLASAQPEYRIAPGVNVYNKTIQWPFDNDITERNRIDSLVKAGALIAAEIDRLQRAGGVSDSSDPAEDETAKAKRLIGWLRPDGSTGSGPGSSVTGEADA